MEHDGFGWLLKNKNNLIGYIGYSLNQSAQNVGSTNDVNITFNYKTGGLEKFDKAYNEYGVDKLFQNILPAGKYTINVSIDSSLPDKVGMQTPNASTILVNPLILDGDLNILGSSIGHELMHVNDFLRGNLNLYDPASVNASEVRAYGWQISTSGHFGLGVEYKTWLIYQREQYQGQ